VKSADKADWALDNIARPLYMRRAALSVVFVFAMFSFLHASDLFQPYRMVNAHTAGVLPKASFDVDFHVYSSPDWPGGGLLPGARVGLGDRFNIGVAYGGDGIVGYSPRVRWNNLPGVLIKYRVVEEGIAAPALAVGFDNQGYGGTADVFRYGYDGYVYKSPGFFAAISKNYLMLKAVQIGFHGTINYSLEEAEEVKWANLTLGSDIGINNDIAFFFEYDFAFNDVTGADNGNHYYALPHNGFLNIGLRWVFTENFYVEFDMLDILENKTRRRYVSLNKWVGEPIGWGRELKVAYITKF